MFTVALVLFCFAVVWTTGVFLFHREFDKRVPFKHEGAYIPIITITWAVAFAVIGCTYLD